MKMERAAGVGGPVVRGFAPGGFRLDEGIYPALLLTIEEATPWTPPPLADLVAGDVQPLIDAAPEFVLLGTGDTLRRPPPAVVTALEAMGIGVEPMDSRAAARAWGVLRGEGRRIGAALYPLG